VLCTFREAYADLWAGQLTTHRPAHEQLGKDYVFNLQASEHGKVAPTYCSFWLTTCSLLYPVPHKSKPTPMAVVAATGQHWSVCWLFRSAMFHIGPSLHCAACVSDTPCHIAALPQDPFDPVDCPARAIGTLHKTNNGVGVLITYLTVCSSNVLSVYQHGSSAGSSSSSIRGRLCQCLAWLFGPQAVLHLAPAQVGVADLAWNGPTEGSADAQSTADWRSWVTCPFDTQLVAKLQRQLSKQTQGSSRGRGRRDSAATPGGIFKWLVNALHASLEPDSGAPVLCLADLHLLNKRIAGGLLEGRLGAALAAGAAGRRAAAQEQRQQLDGYRREWQLRRLLGPPLHGVDAGILGIREQLLAVMRAQRWQPRADSKPRPPGEHNRTCVPVSFTGLQLGCSWSTCVVWRPAGVGCVCVKWWCVWWGCWGRQGNWPNCGGLA